jgi:hypothetical protein
MKTRTLAPKFRTNLKSLLQGFAEHCEISEWLSGRIEQPIYFHGFKFGAPVFTFTGPEGDEGHARRTIGLLGHNSRTSNVASEVLLQLIEVATLRPELAIDQVLRVLPVSDPVTLELETDAPDLTEWPVLQYLADEFRSTASSGLIEVRPSSGKSLVIKGSVDVRLYQVLASNAGDRRGLPSLPLLSSFVTVGAEDRWHLEIEVPDSWTHAGDVLAVSRFIGRILETHAHLLATCKSHTRKLP